MDLLAIGTWLAHKLLNLKTLGVLIVLAVLAYGQYQFYDWAHTRGVTAGVASQAPKIHQLTDELASTKLVLTTTKANLAEWISRYNTYVATSKQQVADLQAQYAATQKHYDQELAKLHATLVATQKELLDEAPTYITQTGSSACTVPLGFVQLYNLSLQDPGTAANAGPTSPASLALADPSRSTFDLPSGLSLLDVSRVIVVNNNAAVTNRALVLGWQAWWHSVSASFEEYQKTHPTTASPAQALLLPPTDKDRTYASPAPSVTQVQEGRLRLFQLAQ